MGERLEGLFEIHLERVASEVAGWGRGWLRGEQLGNSRFAKEGRGSE